METSQTFDSQLQAEIEQCEPVLDFTSNESSALLKAGVGTLHFEDKKHFENEIQTVDLNVEVRLDLLRNPQILFHTSGKKWTIVHYPISVTKYDV